MRADLPLDHLSRPALLDDVPHLLEGLARMIDQILAGEEAPQAPVPQASQHGVHRAYEGTRLNDVIAEYAMLRRVIHRHWIRPDTPTFMQLRERVDGALDDAMAQSVEQFVRSRERQAQALDRISRATLETDSTQELLQRLLQILVEETPAVDIAAIHLREGDQLRVVAAVGLGQPSSGWRLRIGEGFAGTIAHRREPLFLTHASSDPLIRSPLLRDKGVQALYGVPLLAQDGSLFGVASMGSLTEHGFEPADQRLLRLLTERAAGAVAQQVLREKADRRLREIEEAHEALEHGDPMFILDADWRYRFMNRAAELLAQRPREAFMGQVIWEVYPDARAFREPYERAVREQRPVSFEAWYEPIGLWSHVTAFPQRRGGLAVFFRDITESKRARQETERLQRLLSVHPDLLYTFDRDQRFTWASPSFLALLGRTLDEVIGRDFEALGYPPELVDLHRNQLDQALTGVVVRGENAFTRPDGEVGYYDYIFVPVRGETGEVEAIAGITRDITERKRREERDRLLAEVSTRLTASLDLEHSLAELPRLAVPVLGDPCAIVLLRDGKVVQLSAFSADPDRDALIHSNLERRSFDLEGRTGMAQVIRTGQSILLTEASEQILPDPGSPLRQMAEALGLQSYLAVPLRARGRILGAMAFGSTRPGFFTPKHLELAQEVADRGALALDNARLVEDLERALRSRDNVLAIVSHDLRNPLATIRMSAHLLKRAPQLAAEGRLLDRIGAIERGTDQMRRLIGDLVDMASLQSGRLAIAPTAQPLQPILNEAAEAHRPAARQHQIELRAELDLHHLQVRCDRDRVLQVLGNLISNALHACSPGDVVTVQARRAGHEVEVSVQDTGPGIPPDDLERIFEPYWTRKRKGEGTGLGLYISRGIVEAHGGHLSVRSTPGQGATFTFTLPVQLPART